MFDAVTHVFWLAFLGLGTTLAGFGAMLHLENQRARRMLRLTRANGTGPNRRVTPQAQERSGSAFLGKLRGFVLRIGERLSAVLGGEARETAADLASAGYRGRDALLIFAFLKTVLPMTAVAVGILWVLMNASAGTGILKPLAFVIAAALGLSKAVDFYVGLKRKKRLDKIRLGFPDLLELLVITSEAGLGPQPALHRVANEMAHTHPELSREILQMVSEMRMTNDRRAAYDKLSNRVPLPEVSVFTQTLDQSDTYGTPFSRAMRTLIAEQRANRLMMVEEQAARLPVLMTLPLIFCIMPAVFIVLLGPAGISIYDNIVAGG